MFNFKVTKMNAATLFLLVCVMPMILAENLDKVQDLLNNLVSGHYYDEMPEGDLSNSIVNPRDDIILPQTVLRDEEHLPYNPLWGHRFLSGGAGEGDQYLSPEGTIHNVHQVKTDSMLPSYCDPPNPCPEGYASADGCLEGAPNTAEFSRDYQVQQNCPCDPEHMFDCANNGNAVNQVQIDGAHRDVRAKKFQEKKSFGGADDNLNERYPRSAGSVKVNPYLHGHGQHFKIVAKKSPLRQLKAPQV